MSFVTQFVVLVCENGIKQTYIFMEYTYMMKMVIS